MFEEFFAAEVALTIILGCIVLFISFKYKAKLLSPRGKEKMRANMPIMKVGALLGLLSLIVYLIAESFEILEGYAPEYGLGKYHEIGEAVHIFLAVVALWIFIRLLNEIRGIEA